MNIVLTGPMGSGKTTLGKAVAHELGMELIDTDHLIAEKAGMSIDEMFNKYGQNGFRKHEAEVIAEVSKFDNHVIATGGGVVLSTENMRRLRRNSVVINLNPSFEMLYERLKEKRGRPLLNTPDFRRELEKHSEGRQPFYNNADFVIKTDNIAAKKVKEKIVAISKMPHVRICGCVSGSNPAKQIQQAIEYGASLVELRLDLIPNPDIRSLVQMSGLPVIATDKKNKDTLITAIEAGCDFVDVEIESPEKEKIIKKAKSNDCKVIVSIHDFEKTPENFPINKSYADLLKIAVKVNSTEDCTRLFNLLKNRNDLIVVGMGTLGTFTRIVAPLLGSYLTYASINQSTAPGQLSLKTMHEIYKRLGVR